MGIIFENILTDLFALSVILIGVFYSYLSHVYGYWARRNVQFIKPTLLVGNLGPTLLQRLSIGELFQQLYHKTSERFIGIWALTRPMLLVCDPELVRTILVKDFQYFKDRGVYIDEVKDPLSGHLFSLAGDKWKNLRAKLTPVFTSGKLKAMFPTVLDCGKGLVQAVGKYADRNETIEAREIAARYTTNIIASVAFGNEIDSFKDPDTPFRYYGRKVFASTAFNGIRLFFQTIFPRAMQVLKMKAQDEDVEKFVFTMLTQTLEYREKNKVTRKDLLQLLIQLRDSGRIQEDGNWESENKDASKSGMTLNEMAAQVWVFYVAGFETSSTALSFCLYELSKNPDIQQKAQKEIDEVSQRYNGDITYEALAEMKYVERCIEETLRKYPVVPLLNRECTKAYKIPDTNTIIEPGTSIVIPVLGLQMNPKYYSNPKKFDPDRFLDDNKSFVERPYLPFGDGPRICIGLRLAKVQTKVGLITLLQKFSFGLGSSMKGELKLSAKLPLMAAVGGLNLTIQRR